MKSAVKGVKMTHLYSCQGNGYDTWDVNYHGPKNRVQVLMSFDAQKIRTKLQQKYPGKLITLSMAYDIAHDKASAKMREIVAEYIESLEEISDKDIIKE